MNEASATGLDRAAARRAFERAAADYDAAAVLQREVATRLLERLDLIRFAPRTVLDAGCGTGFALPALHRRWPGARLLGLDLAVAMARRARRALPWWRRRRLRVVAGDLQALPLRDASVDLVFSSLALQWCDDLDAALGECRRVLRPGGLLLFTTFGPDTLKELRAAWAEADGHVHVNTFTDLHDVGDALVRQGFADPVTDAEWITVTYRTVRDLMHDLKAVGAHNVNRGRPHGLTGRGRLARMEAAYEKFRVDGRLPATHEIVYGHAFVPELEPGVRPVAWRPRASS